MPTAGTSPTLDSLIEEVRSLLGSLATRDDAGSPPYLREFAETVKSALSVEPLELFQFLERYGYIVVDRANGVMGVTQDGRRVVQGDKLADFAGDLQHQYEQRLSAPSRRKPRRFELLDGRYRRFSAIGSGALGTVYRGEVVSTRREVAVKEIREIFAYFTAAQKQEILRRFERIVCESSRISHPNIIQILDQNAKREFPYFVMEVASGGSLRRLMTRSDPIPPSLILAYFIQICQAIKAAHSLDVIHRAIKPENVLLDIHGNVKLSDFGMSRTVERGPGRGGQVFVGMGSVGYMAPEQFQDPRLADVRSDIYSLGILFYEMVTTRLPGRRSPMPSEVREDLPKGIDTVFDRMTQDDPDDRYPLIEALLDDVYRVDGILSLLDRRGAILMHRSPFVDLGLSPLSEETGGGDEEYGGETAPSESASASAAQPVRSSADGPPPAAAEEREAPFGGAPPSYTEQQGPTATTQIEDVTSRDSSHLVLGSPAGSASAPVATPGSVDADATSQVDASQDAVAPPEGEGYSVSDDLVLEFRAADGVQPGDRGSQPGGDRFGSDPGVYRPPQRGDKPVEPIMPKRRFGVPPPRKK